MEHGVCLSPWLICMRYMSCIHKSYVVYNVPCVTRRAFRTVCDGSAVASSCRLTLGRPRTPVPGGRRGLGAGFPAEKTLRPSRRVVIIVLVIIIVII